MEIQIFHHVKIQSLYITSTWPNFSKFKNQSAKVKILILI
jgi:hypothetical protein